MGIFTIQDQPSVRLEAREKEKFRNHQLDITKIHKWIIPSASKQRKFDVLLFWALDRLTREGTLATLQYLERLTPYDVGYKSFTEPYLDSCGTFKDVVISLLATMAKQERLRMGERVRAGLQRVRSQGKRLGRPPLRVLTPDEVLKLRKERVQTKASFREIAMKYGISVWSAHSLCGRHRQSAT
jgi:DNA invertase Pin-like site-specific DNA recombinase